MLKAILSVFMSPMLDTETEARAGHESWADYPYFGTQNFFFFEDNTIVGNGMAPSSGSSDAEFGARFVIRHNDWTNARPGWHGTEGGRVSRNSLCRDLQQYKPLDDWPQLLLIGLATH